ncbi:hypothetical protein CEXT_355041 [Caerostris extrusa]|uniref:HIT domain-containing protein n=1 Tax=Caerostris extrusa TaxID=172846 RepID=A0AAV4UQK2_CAEEX|nr:hypothetical protein CEXT_355041 [Caerostris extrusa]
MNTPGTAIRYPVTWSLWNLDCLSDPLDCIPIYPTRLSTQHIPLIFFLPCLESDDSYLAFRNITPAASHHYLIIPKEHIRDAVDLKPHHIPMRMLEKIIHKKHLTFNVKRKDLPTKPVSFAVYQMEAIAQGVLRQQGAASRNKRQFKRLNNDRENILSDYVAGKSSFPVRSNTTQSKTRWATTGPVHLRAAPTPARNRPRGRAFHEGQDYIPAGHQVVPHGQ